MGILEDRFSVTEVLIAFLAVLGTGVFAFLCLVLWRKIKLWQAEQYIRRRAETLSREQRGLTMRDRAAITKKVLDYKFERLKKASRNISSSNFFLGWGLLIIIAIVLMFLAIINRLSKG